MKENIIGKLVYIVLVALMAFNAFMLVSIWQLIRTDSLYRKKKVEYILPDGYTPTKTKILWEETLPVTSGWVVRYASSSCMYCKLDYEWEYLFHLLKSSNYRTLLLLPRSDDQFEEDQIQSEGIRQLAYVKMDWIKQFRFTKTPTVVIFDSSGRVLWQHRGMLKDADYESAKKVVIRNIKR